MGVLDNGGQKISFDYRNIGTSKDFNKLNYLIQNRGIYEEGTLTKITDVAVKINAGLIAIANDISNEVSCRIETTELSNEIVVSPTNCFVIMSFVWIDTPENYAEFSAVPYSAITANDIIIGKCIYESVTLVSFDYGKQTKPNVTNETYGLNVICNEPSDDKVYIQPGQAVINGKLVTISSAIAVDVPEHTSGAVSRTDIIVLDDAGAGDIITNRTSVDPPLYPNSNNIVLAEITRTADGDIVIDNHITNVLNIPIQNVMDPLVINTLVTDDATIENAEINSLKRKIVFEKNPNSAWSQIGSGLSISAVGYSSITSLSSTDIAFIDYTSAELRTYRWSGSAWSQIGSSLSISSGGYSSITSLSSTDIAFIDNSIKELRTYRWSGSAWSQIGSGLSISSVGNSSITSLSSTDTAFIDHTIAELRTYRLSFTEFPPNPAFGTL